MRRLIRYIAECLVLGTITTILAAWICAAWVGVWDSNLIREGVTAQQGHAWRVAIYQRAGAHYVRAPTGCLIQRPMHHLSYCATRRTRPNRLTGNMWSVPEDGRSRLFAARYRSLGTRPRARDNLSTDLLRSAWLTWNGSSRVIRSWMTMSPWHRCVLSGVVSPWTLSFIRRLGRSS